MKLATKVAYNTIIQVLSKFVSNAITIIVAVIVIRHLGKFGFGQYTTIITFISFFAIFSDFGLTLVTVQMISKPKAKVDKILGNLLTMRLFLSIIFLGIAPLVVLFFPYDPIIKKGVLIASSAFLFIALNQVLVGLFQKKLRMDKVSIAEIVSKVVLVVSIIFSINQGYGLNGILVSTVISSLVSFVIHFYFASRFTRIRLRFDMSIWKECFKYSWPLAITIALNLIYLKTDTLLLSIIKRPSEIGITEEVGLYGSAYKVIDVVITIPFMFAGIILPIMTNAWVSNKKEVFKNITQKAFNIMAIVAIPMAIGTQFVSEEVITLICGEEFIEAGATLKLLIIAASMIFLGNIFAHGIIAIDKQKKMIGAYLFVAISSVIGYILLIPQYSLAGAASVTIYSETVITVASVFVLWKYTNFIPSLIVPMKAFFASIIMSFGILYFVLGTNLHILTILLFSVGIYFLSLLLFRGIEKDDLLSLINR